MQHREETEIEQMLSLRHCLRPVVAQARLLLAHKLFPPVGQPLHLHHASGVNWIEVEIEAAVDGWDCAIWIWPFLQIPCITWLNNASFEHARVEARTVLPDRQLDPVGAANPPRQIGARHARPAHLHQRAAHAHDVASADSILAQSVEREVLAHCAGLQIHLIVFVPEAVVVEQVDAEIGVGATVIGLRHFVAFQATRL